MRRLLFAVSVLAASLAAQQFEPQPPSFAFLQKPPRGLPPMPAPTGYTPTAAMFELGKELFHDGVLSKDRSVSCASCHPAATGFAHPDPRPPGIAGQLADRHAPALWNRGYGMRQRWDGRSASLEEFVLEPIADPKEMGHDVASAVARLNAEAPWRAKFATAFGGPASPTAVQQALATFVRGIVAGDAPYDRFLAGDPSEMTPQQRHGQWLFESKGGCWKCHTPPLFTDEDFHATGVGEKDGEPEPGHAVVTKQDADRGKWKTPTLRGVRLTAPYMHDGSLRTLADVVEFYARGGNRSRNLDARLHPLDLTAEDKQALVAFLTSL
jgi:cytochrome c peroxidase